MPLLHERLLGELPKNWRDLIASGAYLAIYSDRVELKFPADLIVIRGAQSEASLIGGSDERGRSCNQFQPNPLLTHEGRVRPQGPA